MQTHTYKEMHALEDTHFWFVGKRLFIQKALENLPKKQNNILDVGIGTGGTTLFLLRYGKVVGLEAQPQAITLARKRGLRVVHGTANSLPFPKESFDMVTFFDVLYHKGIDEKRALSEAFRVLKPKGVLCITDCAYPWLWSKHDVIMEAKYRYTKTKLSTFVLQAGFRIERCEYIFTSIFLFFICSRLFHPSPHKLTRLPLFFNNLLVLLLRSEALLPWKFPRPFGSSILILAHKL
ncbi:MAG: class I SAM-dependent methyltransferase [Candidatus Pacebacteria bacterium]|nr:class I SAM-dependent methyltransferase [Candidatus Paceibacterota bacterium]